MTIRTTILAMIGEVAQLTDCVIKAPLTNDTVLLDSGLDSLGFAILVARLEEELSLDPFSSMTNAVYPRTLVEFVTIYENACD